MSFIRKIKRGNKVYLAEVENKWIDGHCVQKHIRYVGTEIDGETKLSVSMSDVTIDNVKVYGPLLVLHQLASDLGLPKILGSYWREILSMVYAHCLSYKSINQMDEWFKQTDLSMILDLESVTEKTLLAGLDSLQSLDVDKLQLEIFESFTKKYKILKSALIYDVTNTYLYGKQCSIGKLGHDKEGVKGRPLIQIGLAVTQDEGFPMFHKVFEGNVHDARTLQDLISNLANYKISSGILVYDRGISSEDNISDVLSLNCDTLCGLALRGDLKKVVTSIKDNFININNRVKLNETTFYVITKPYKIGSVNGTLAVCYNEQQAKDLRESRYDEILNAQEILTHSKKPIKHGLEKYFDKNGTLIESALTKAQEFDGYSCLFTTKKFSKEEMIYVYFDKDVIEKAFRTLKGVTSLQPIRHWLHNRVNAHVMLCYLAYALLSMLKYQLRSMKLSPEHALQILKTMYKVYMRDNKNRFQISRVVTLSKTQKNILRLVNPKLIKT
jgi:transposase